MNRFALGFALATLVIGTSCDMPAPPQAQDPNHPAPTPNIAAHPAEVVGPTDAAIVVEEYSDYQCPYCAEHERRHASAVRALITARKDARFEFYDLVVPGHRDSPIAAAAARCVALLGGEYAQARSTLFTEQDAWSGRNNAREQIVTLLAPFTPGGSTAIDACLDDPSHDPADALEGNLQRAISLGVTGTPTIVIRVGDQTRSYTGETHPDKIDTALRELAGN